MMLIDLIVLLPPFLPNIGIDLRMLRMLRLFKAFRYIRALHLISRVVEERKSELLASVILVLFLLFMSSTVIYFVEHPAQPDKFTSIPASMWWGVATLTTVGYGDIFPITPLGKFMGGLIAMLGIGLFAIPTGILASGFSSRLSTPEEKAEKDRCPHCGKSRHEPSDNPEVEL